MNIKMPKTVDSAARAPIEASTASFGAESRAVAGPVIEQLGDCEVIPRLDPAKVRNLDMSSWGESGAVAPETTPVVCSRDASVPAEKSPARFANRTVGKFESYVASIRNAVAARVEKFMVDYIDPVVRFLIPPLPDPRRLAYAAGGVAAAAALALATPIPEPAPSPASDRVYRMSLKYERGSMGQSAREDAANGKGAHDDKGKETRFFKPAAGFLAVLVFVGALVYGHYKLAQRQFFPEPTQEELTEKEKEPPTSSTRVAFEEQQRMQKKVGDLMDPDTRKVRKVDAATGQERWEDAQPADVAQVQPYIDLADEFSNVNLKWHPGDGAIIPDNTVLELVKKFCGLEDPQECADYIRMNLNSNVGRYLNNFVGRSADDLSVGAN